MVQTYGFRGWGVDFGEELTIEVGRSSAVLFANSIQFLGLLSKMAVFTKHTLSLWYYSWLCSGGLCISCLLPSSCWLKVWGGIGWTRLSTLGNNRVLNSLFVSFPVPLWCQTLTKWDHHWIERPIATPFPTPFPTPSHSSHNIAASTMQGLNDHLRAREKNYLSLESK